MKSSNVKIQFTNGEVGEYDKGSSLLDIARERAVLYTSPIVAAKVNNEIKDLQSRVDSDCSIDFLDLQTETGIKVYERSLTFVMIAAAKELFPNATLTV